MINNYSFGNFLLTGLMIFSLNAAPLDLKDAKKRISENNRRVENLCLQAEQIRSKEPDFADWVKYQREIHRSFERAAYFDLKNEPQRLPITLEDWEKLISRMEKEIVVFRTLPDPKKNGKLNVRDFGAKGDGITDDAPVIRKAIEAAQSENIRTVYIPAGTYLVEPQPGDPENVIFRLDKKNDILIQGEPGTRMISSNPLGAWFKLTDCSNVRIQNLHKSSKKFFYSSGIVTGYEGEKSFIVRIDAGTPPDDPIFSQSGVTHGSGLVRFFSKDFAADGRTPLFYHGDGNAFWGGSVRKGTQENEYVFTPPDNYFPKNKTIRELVKLGERAVYFAREHNALFRLIRSMRCRIQNVSSESSSGINFMTEFSEATFVTDCTIAAPANASIAIASAADICFSHAGALGDYFARNTFKNACDDFINVHGFMHPVLLQEGNVIYVTDDLTESQLEALTRIYLIKTPAGETFKRDRNLFHVVKVEKTQLLHDKLHVDRKKTAGGKVHYQEGPREQVPVLKLTLDRMPGELVTTWPAITSNEYQMRNAWCKEKFDMVYFPDSTGIGQVFAENYFADGVSRILPTGNGSLLINNTIVNRLKIYCFFRVSYNDFIKWWNETYYTEHVTVKNNKFISSDCRFFNMADTAYDPADRSSWARHFVFSGNTIDFRLPSSGNDAQNLFWIRGCDDVVITDNVVISRAKKRGEVYRLKDTRAKISGNKIKGNFQAPIIDHSSVRLEK